MPEDDPLAYLRGEVGEGKQEAPEAAFYRSVRVFLEIDRRGTLSRGGVTPPLLTSLSRQVVGCGLSLKSEWGAHLDGILVLTQTEAPKEIGFFGMDQVYLFHNPEEASLKELTGRLYEFLSSRPMGLTLFPASRFSLDVAPRLAERFGTGLVMNVASFFLRATEQVLEMSRPVFLGRMMETVIVSAGRPPMSILQEGVFAEASADKKEASPIQNIT